MHKIAVYGTLKHGGRNSHLLSSSELIGIQRLEGWKLYTNGLYPHAVPSDESIHIEIYEVSSAVLAQLDHLEGYDALSPRRSMYQRMTVETECGPALIYYMTRRVWGTDRVPSGKFMQLTIQNGVQ
jgi:gamma-glutamylcyclotransferase (GGCT)/AIG2-like uncharacterized protein YtfP